jgi:hypothetical protein
MAIKTENERLQKGNLQQQDNAPKNHRNHPLMPILIKK